jgi:seryl-tRNA synthetase
MEAKEKALTIERDEKVGALGNLVHESVPVSNNEDNNKVLRPNLKILT